MRKDVYGQPITNKKPVDAVKQLAKETKKTTYKPKKK